MGGKEREKSGMDPFFPYGDLGRGDFFPLIRGEIVDAIHLLDEYCSFLFSSFFFHFLA
jgi:hypothetical protein